MTRRAKATKEMVKAIRAEYMPYVRGYGYLAKKHGLGETTVRDILTYRTHVHVRD